jgi:hypothetical protein
VRRANAAPISLGLTASAAMEREKPKKKLHDDIPTLPRIEGWKGAAARGFARLSLSCIFFLLFLFSLVLLFDRSDLTLPKSSSLAFTPS